MEGKNYKKWVATDDEKTCLTCISYDGRIFPKDEIVRPHINCRCIAESVSSIYAGEASKDGKRNIHRVLWSNDGLVFVTYDHYVTFYEII